MRLLVILIMVGNLCADTVKYKLESNWGVSTLTKEGEYLGTYNSEVFIRLPNQKLWAMNCDWVSEISTTGNEPISWNCSENTFESKVLTESDIIGINKKPYIGITLFTIGGILLHIGPDQECSDCTNIESLDQKKVFARAGVICISLGGILIALGI